MRTERGQDVRAALPASGRGTDADEHFGRMSDPTAAARIRGICGEEMEFYLVISDGVITEARYYSDGCPDTRICGRTVAERACGSRVIDALGLSPRDIICSEESLSESGRHCAILAVSTLYRAIADYLLMP